MAGSDRAHLGPGVPPYRSPALAGFAGWAAATTILDQVAPLIWVLVALSAGGAALTYAFLVYAIMKFRDPNTRRRTYG